MKKLFPLIMLLISVLMPFAPDVSADQPAMMLTDDVLLKLGDAFTSDGDYYRAITEYKRLLILFPQSSKADNALFSIGMAYFRGEEYESASKTFSSLRGRFPQSSFVAKAAYHQGLCLSRLGKPEEASEAFSAAATPAAGRNEEAKAASFGMAMAALDRNDITSSRSTLEQFVRQYPDDSGVLRAKEAIALLDKSLTPPYKSPFLAGTMSAILPGSGQLYAGRYGDALTSLLLNGLFIAGTVVAVQNDNYALAGVTGLIGLPFYIGNIYGASNAATKWNIGLKKDLRGNMALILEYPF